MAVRIEIGVAVAAGLLSVSAVQAAPRKAAPVRIARRAAQASAPRPAAQLVNIEVLPPQVTLDGGRDGQTLLVTGRYSDGTARDLTSEARFISANASVVRVEGNTVWPAESGETTVAAKVTGAAPVSVPVTAKSADELRPISFRDDVIPA